MPRVGKTMDRKAAKRRAEAPAPKEEKWFSSGRGVFCHDAGFQLATMPLTVSWQEDTARIVALLNKGERFDAEIERLKRENAELRAGIIRNATTADVEGDHECA